MDELLKEMEDFIQNNPNKTSYYRPRAATLKKIEDIEHTIPYMLQLYRLSFMHEYKLRNVKDVFDNFFPIPVEKITHIEDHMKEKLIQRIEQKIDDTKLEDHYFKNFFDSARFFPSKDRLRLVTGDFVPTDHVELINKDQQNEALVPYKKLARGSLQLLFKGESSNIIDTLLDIVENDYLPRSDQLRFITRSSIRHFSGSDDSLFGHAIHRSSFFSNRFDFSSHIDNIKNYRHIDLVEDNHHLYLPEYKAQIKEHLLPYFWYRFEELRNPNAKIVDRLYKVSMLKKRMVTLFSQI